MVYELELSQAIFGIRSNYIFMVRINSFAYETQLNGLNYTLKTNAIHTTVV